MNVTFMLDVIYTSFFRKQSNPEFQNDNKLLQLDLTPQPSDRQ